MSTTILITGASTGFGRDAAERLARRGHHVFATMRDASGRNAEHRAALERLASSEELRLRVLELDVTGNYADRVIGVFQSVISAPGAPGSEEVAEALVRLVEMDPAERSFHTIVSAPIQQLLEPYNTTAEALRSVVAQIFNVPDLAQSTVAATA